MDNITLFGPVEGEIDETVQILRERNVGVVIRNEHDLNVTRLREEKTMQTSKGKENACSSATRKGKAKENVTCQVTINYDVTSKCALPQGMYSGCTARQIAQRKRRDREKLGECIQPKNLRLNEECTARQLAQRKRRERERLDENIQPIQSRRRLMNGGINETVPIASNQTMVGCTIVSSSAINNVVLDDPPNAINQAMLLHSLVSSPMGECRAHPQPANQIGIMPSTSEALENMGLSCMMIEEHQNRPSKTEIDLRFWYVGILDLGCWDLHPNTRNINFPEVKCKTKVYHPNIDLDGHDCLNILREDRKPTINITPSFMDYFISSRSVVG